jgi:hypothetical protein
MIQCFSLIINQPIVLFGLTFQQSEQGGTDKWRSPIPAPDLAATSVVRRRGEMEGEAEGQA